VRFVHWLSVVCFFGAYVTSQEEGSILIHVTFGYTLVGLMIFRIFWGFAGTKYALFVQFVRGPKAVYKYFESLVTKEPEHHIGHNPAGAIAIIALIFLAIAVAISGFSALHETWKEWGEALHEDIANLMLILVLVHIGAVFVSSLIHQESLVKSMITGNKKIDEREGIKKTHGMIALVIAILVASFWTYQFINAESGGVDGPALLSQHGETGKDDD
jgi:cytochrome b